MSVVDKNHAEHAQAREQALVETSDERFDRVAFAERIVALACPRGTTVAVCGGARHLHVATGRQWGGAPGARWAMLAVPPSASRRAIALAVAEIAGTEGDGAWVYDVMFGDALASHPHLPDGSWGPSSPYRD